jgi:N4-gp56 family major capsid protein
MALNNFIPELWSARLLFNLQKALVYAQEGIVNRDYEGEIQAMGDTVRINSIGPVTVGDYAKNTNIGDPETLTDAQQSLLIDQAKYFNFQVDDVDRAQQKPAVMDGAMRESGYALRDRADQYVAGLHAQAASGNAIGSDASPKTDLGTAANAYNYLVDLGVLLDEANVPSEGRWVIVPSWFHGVILKDDRFVKSGTPAGDRVLRNGEVGEAAGFRILKSNNVPNTSGTKYKILAGHPLAISYADQVVKVEGYRPEKRFADAVKGLHVYGAKVVRPKALAVLTANRP